MRVIAGQWKGRRLVAPDTRGTRPVTDKVKESLFSSLAPAVSQARVADLYAGSGSLGIEALSRGASTAVFVERGRKALTALRSNLEALEAGDRAAVVTARVERYLGDPGPVFDIVFCDPPWDLDRVSLESVLGAIRDRIDPAGVIVITRRAVAPVPRPRDLVIADERRHGDTRIIRYVTETTEES